MPIELPRGLPFAVDTWTPASALKRHRFLTHAHRDHLAGITTTSAVYASRLTVLIVRHIFPQVNTSLHRISLCLVRFFYLISIPVFLGKFPLSKAWAGRVRGDGARGAGARSGSRRRLHRHCLRRQPLPWSVRQRRPLPILANSLISTTTANSKSFCCSQVR